VNRHHIRGVNRVSLSQHVVFPFISELARPCGVERRNPRFSLYLPSYAKRPRPPPGELTEAALEHFIAPGFATKCGNSLLSGHDLPKTGIHFSGSCPRKIRTTAARTPPVSRSAAGARQRSGRCRHGLPAAHHLSAACLRTRTTRSGGGGPISRCQIVPLSNWIVMPSGE
jgi:hypothetical protein